MQRIVKRFLLHKQRETDEGESDISEIKQDLQMVRFEMINDLKKTREETLRLVNNIQNGLFLIGEEVFKTSESDAARRFRDYKSPEFEGNDPLDLSTDLAKTELISANNSTHSHSNSNDSGINSMKESASLYQMKTAEGRTVNSIESLGSSIDTQSSIESINEQALVNNLEPIDEDVSTPNEPEINDAQNNKVENKVKFSMAANELHVINEEEELESSWNKKRP